MADRVICPVCGESNPADMEFCRNCQSRLRPTQGDNEAIQPGELPTKKTTSELEPLLPQWLRDARQKARDSSDEPGMPEQPSAEEPASSSPDLLAGLVSQSSDEEEDVPEWLAQITGAQSKKKKPVPEDNQVKWVELGRGDEPQEAPPSTESQAPATEPAKDELGDWFKQAAASSQTVDFSMPTPAPEETQPPADAARPPEQEDLSWLRNLGAAAAAPAEETPASAPADFGETPDWLKKLQADQAPAAAPQTPEAGTPPQSAIPDWLKSFDEETPAAQPAEPAAPQTPANEEPIFEPELPDWLKSAQPAADETPETPVSGPEPTHKETPAPVELPDWISALGGSQLQPPAEEQTKPATPIEGEAQPAELPDWISALGASQPQPPAQGEIKSLAPAEQEQQPAAATPEPPAALPDWLSSLRLEQEGMPPTQPALEPEKPAEELAEPGAALTSDALSGEDADAVFASMQTPDWLSAVLPAARADDENVPAAAPEEEPIVPAELPSWVQAMRPVESAMGTAAPSAAEDAATEAQGPLAGLHGVLPAIPGAALPSSKPKAHSIKLVATEQQQAHAALLEQILAAETSPVPMRSAGSVLRSQRVLRWALSILLILVIGGIVFARTEIFQLPGSVPNETVGAIQAIESVPEGAPVLLVFDYQPATVGEMEASGASLIDHLLLLKHPNLALLSTSPTGAALAERFLSTTLADRAYARGAQYVDLGFLPGGLAGVYNFAQNPRATVPLDASARPVWGSGILTHVERYSDFAAVIVLTDSVESGRTWVEQTQATRGKSLLVLVASAQAGPMLLPYVDSGQVNGMVSGIYGAVGTEQRNAGSPAIYGLPGGSQPNSQPTGYIRRYWDAYSAGLYLAVIAIVLGALVNVWLGLRERRANAVM